MEQLFEITHTAAAAGTQDRLPPNKISLISVVWLGSLMEWALSHDHRKIVS
jgi:hypothetical protein